jgi:tetratricopeptide (TPR) repeat protein
MRYYILIIVTTIYASLSYTQARDLQQLADSAIVYYNSGDYQSAINNYDEIIANGQESAELFYNLGNAYYKSGNTALAITNYERALLLSPNDEDILFNLKLSKSQTVDKIETLPVFFLDSWYSSFTKMFSSNAWAYISLFSFLLGLVFLLGFLFSRTIVLKKVSFFVAGFFLTVTLVSFTSSYHQKKQYFDRSYAIITNPSVNIKSSPDENSTSLFILHSGTKLEVLDKIQSWYKIKIENGNTGWIKTDDVEKI